MSVCGEVIWITGASSGLGKALVEELAQGNRLIISGRDESVLDQIAARWPSVSVLAFDMADERAVAQAEHQLCAMTPYIDRVILNAGTCEYFNIDAPDWSMIKRVMTVNYLGSINCLQIALERLKSSTRGHVVCIGSLATMAPFTRAQAYGASKAALHYFMSALRIDLQRFNIDVTLIKPGFIDTPLTRKNDFKMPFIVKPAEAARRIAVAMEKRVFCYAFPWKLYGLLWLLRRFPRWWTRRQSVAFKTKKHRSGDTAADVRES